MSRSVAARIALNKTLTEDRRRVLYLSGQRKRQEQAAAEWRARMSWYPHGLDYALAQARTMIHVIEQNEQRLEELKGRIEALEGDPIIRRLTRLERHLGVPAREPTP